MNINCPLCLSAHILDFDKDYHLCENCKGIFLKRELLLNNTEEKARYCEHNNDVSDTRYQKFVSPITDRIIKYFSTDDIGLDFGAGTGPVISKVLNDKGYNVKIYDPFFHNYPDFLNNKYNYIACCEVIEHFHNPYREFTLLKNLLCPSGKLFCMTHIYNSQIPFANWYYRKDPTHVFIYQQKTLLWIKKHFGFKELSYNERLVVFSI